MREDDKNEEKDKNSAEEESDPMMKGLADKSNDVKEAKRATEKDME